MRAADFVGERDRDPRRQFSKPAPRRDEEVADGLRSGKSRRSLDRPHLLVCRITMTFNHDNSPVVRVSLRDCTAGPKAAAQWTDLSDFYAELFFARKFNA